MHYRQHLAGVLGLCPGFAADPEKFSGLVVGVFAGNVSPLPPGPDYQAAAFSRVHLSRVFLDSGYQSLA